SCLEYTTQRFLDWGPQEGQEGCRRGCDTVSSMKRALAFALALCWALAAEPVHVPGLQQQVEILRDRWGVPHIYAATVHDLFFAQGYITAVDRLFQIDLWRRTGTGKLAEVLGPS